MPTNKPPVLHYAHGVGGAGIQPIDFMESNFTPDEYRGYLKGQIIKYISRYQYKGKPIEDLHKARIYLDWLIEHEGGYEYTIKYHRPEDGVSLSVIVFADDAENAVRQFPSDLSDAGCLIDEVYSYNEGREKA